MNEKGGIHECRSDERFISRAILAGRGSTNRSYYFRANGNMSLLLRKRVEPPAFDAPERATPSVPAFSLTRFRSPRLAILGGA